MTVKILQKSVLMAKADWQTKFTLNGFGELLSRILFIDFRSRVLINCGAERKSLFADTMKSNPTAVLNINAQEMFLRCVRWLKKKFCELKINEYFCINLESMFNPQNIPLISTLWFAQKMEGRKK